MQGELSLSSGSCIHQLTAPTPSTGDPPTKSSFSVATSSESSPPMNHSRQTAECTPKSVCAALKFRNSSGRSSTVYARKARSEPCEEPKLCSSLLVSKTGHLELTQGSRPAVGHVEEQSQVELWVEGRSMLAGQTLKKSAVCTSY